MTLKTSLFNKGIYKSTLRRFKWGSVLYFVILFMTLILPTMLNSIYLGVEESFNISRLYHYDALYSPVMLAMCVAVVVGALVYGFMHSKKTSVFINSMPVSRTSVYISTVLASLTLMSLPVIASGIIFFIMALTTHTGSITLVSCFVWTGINLMTLLMMFACSSFVAMLTGNKLASICLNFLFHGILPVIVICFSGFANMFLWGYVAENIVMDKVIEGNFPGWIISSISHIRVDIQKLSFVCNDDYPVVRMIIYLVISILLYVLGWVLYKKRNLETAEDIAGFKVLNPIFKYLITFLGASVAFGIWSGRFVYTPVSSAISILLTTAVFYFGMEMLLKKSMKVWKSSWKGFVIFSVLFTLMVMFFMLTGFFGYETRVPDVEDVESVTAYHSYYDSGFYAEPPFLKDEAVISQVVKVHKDIVAERKIMEDDYNYLNMSISYKLKNGSELKREYNLSRKQIEKIMGQLYEVETYKNTFELPLRLKESEILYIERENKRLYGANMLEFNDCLAEDIKNHSYAEIKTESEYCTVVYYYNSDKEDGKFITDSCYVTIPGCFENTIKWLETNDYKFIVVE